MPNNIAELSEMTREHAFSHAVKLQGKIEGMLSNGGDRDLLRSCRMERDELLRRFPGVAVQLEAQWARLRVRAS